MTASTSPESFKHGLECEVQLQPARKWGGEIATITATLPSGRTTTFTAYGPRSEGGEPEVNWSAIGSTGLVDAKAFAEALEYAVYLAATLDGPTGAAQ